MEKKIGIAYARVSTEEQAEYSPSAQIADIFDYATKNNIHIPQEFIFVDEGISGKSAENRPAFQQMIKTARKKSNNVSVIVVHKFDRFSRKKDDQVLYKALLKKDGVKVVSVKEPIPEDDKFAVIYESMLEAMAEYYSLNLAEEVKKTMVQKAKNGEWQTTAPFGYRNENKTLALVPEEADVVKMIFTEYINGTSILQITTKINASGFRTHRGNVFENRTVQYILNNPVYCGFVRWTPNGRVRRDFYNENTLTVKGSHPPIIDEETFKKASDKWKAGRRKSIPHQRPITDGKHWLSGIVKCSHCGRSLVISHYNKSGGFAMQCGGYAHGQCQKSHSVTSAYIINEFLKEIKRISSYGNSDKKPLNFSQKEISEDTGAIYRSLLIKAKTKLNNAKNAYLDGIDSLAEYKENKTRIEAEIKDLEAKIEATKKDSRPVNTEATVKKINDLYDILTDKNIEMQLKKEAVRAVVEKIVYYKDTNSFELFLYAF